MTHAAVVAVFLKYPEPGKVKTRLAADIGFEEAAQVYRRLAEITIARLPAEVAVVAYCAPDPALEQCESWLLEMRPGIPCRPQGEGGLGQRLIRAIRELFARTHGPVIIIGTDCIELEHSHFEEAISQLQTHDVVLGPTEDGGYFLVGMKQPHPAVFQNIRWSTEYTLQDTMRQCGQAGLSVGLLDQLGDIDSVRDLERIEALGYRLRTIVPEAPRL